MIKIIIILLVIVSIYYIVFSEDEEVIKKEEKKKISKNITKKELYVFDSSSTDHISELLKEDIEEEIVINYVCEEKEEIIEIKNGFIEEDGDTYYYEENNKIIGEKEIDGNYYYFDEEGRMIVSSFIDNNYYNEEGIKVQGFYEVDGDYYYFGEDGYYKDTFIEDKYFDINGKYVEGIKEENGIVNYYNNDKLYKGLIKLNDIRYYFDFMDGHLIKKNVESVVDISTWQDTINFEELKNSNEVDKIILRIGFGSFNGEECTLDNRFDEYIKEIQRLNIPYGLYFYGYAQNEFAASIEADFVNYIMNKYNLDKNTIIFYDAENTFLNGIFYTKQLYENVVNTFINRLNSYGYSNVGLYGNLSMLSSGTLSFKKDYPVWVAQYYDKCEYDEEYVGWQYTSKGSIPGINGNVDLNIFY